MDVFDLTKKFNEKNYMPSQKISEWPDDFHVFRMKFMEEELNEYSKAYIDNDHAGMLDALCDLVYVAVGTAYLYGWDFNEAFRRVHRANMEKTRAYVPPYSTDPEVIREAFERAKSLSKRNSAYDIVKPEGWVAPVLNDLV